MRLIDRYILKIFIGYLLGGIVVFVTLYLAVDVLSFAIGLKASSSALIRYYAYQIPGLVYQLVPVACLMATLFTYSGLHRSNELVALFSSGMSLWRVAVPTLTLVVVMAALLFFANDQVTPILVQKKNYVEYVEIKNKPGLYNTVKTNRIWYRSENILFNINTLNPEAARAQGMTLYYFDKDWNLVQLVTAKDVELKKPAWILHNGFVTLFATESSFPLTKPFESKEIEMNEDLGDIQSSSNTSDVMTMNELKKFIDHNRDAGLDTIRYEVDYHSKFGFAFASVIMALLGVPFSISRTRSGGAMLNLGICIGLAFSYWALFSSCLTLGRHGAIPPVMAAWSANFVMGILSLILLRRLNF